jgi:hypothetical protein
MRAPHLPGCAPIISREGGFEVLVGYRCEPDCPQRDEWISNLVSPEANLKAAMEFVQRTYGMRLHSGWHTWRPTPSDHASYGDYLKPEPPP